MSPLLQRLRNADYYAILRVEPSASALDIKRAFYRIAAQYHPDRYEGCDPHEAQERTAVYKIAVEAYSTLSHPSVRAQYDKLRQAGHKRMDRVAVLEQALHERSKLGELTTHPSAKEHANQADQLWSRGELEDARAHMVSACRHDPHNRALREKLDELYRALEG